MSRVFALILVAAGGAVPTRYLTAAEPSGAAPILPPGALATFGRVPFHNGAEIRASELSPDGKRLATLSARSATVWDTATGQPLRRFFFPVPEWPGRDGVLAFSADGKWLAARPTADCIAVWDVTTGREVKRFPLAATNSSYSFCRFSADGAALIAQTEDDVVWLSVKTGAVIRRLPGVRLNRLTPDERTFAISLETEQRVVVGDARTGKIQHRLPVAGKTDGGRREILFLADGVTLAVEDNVEHNRVSPTRIQFRTEVQFWDLRTGKRRAETWRLRTHPNYQGGSYRLTLSPDGKVLYAAEDKTVRRWSVAASAELPPMPLGDSPAAALYPHPDGKTLFSVHRQGFRRWDLATGKQLTPDEAFVDWDEATAVTSRDGRWLAVATSSEQRRLELWDTERRRGTRVTPATWNRHNLAFSPDGTTLAVNGCDHFPLLRVPELTEIKKIPERVGEACLQCNALQFSPDGRRLAALTPGHLRLVDAATGKAVGSVMGATAALFTPDGKKILVASERGGGALRLHDVETQRVRWDIRVPSDRASERWIYRDGPRVRVMALAFSPDGRILAVALSGGHVALLDAATGKERRRFLSMPTDERWAGGRYLCATALAFSPGGHWLAVGGADGFLRIWEVATCRELHRLHGHQGSVAALTFTADGRRLVSFGHGEGFLWDLQPSKLRASIPR